MNFDVRDVKASFGITLDHALEKIPRRFAQVELAENLPESLFVRGTEPPEEGVLEVGPTERWRFHKH